MDTVPLLEATMLLCFGISWPLASLRMLRLRRSQGRGLRPTGLILAGYLTGMAANLRVACDSGVLQPMFWFYLLNAASVSVNLALQWHFGRRPAPRRAVVVA